MAGSEDRLPPQKARLILLQDELALAQRWNTSCILIAVTRSEITRRKVATKLQRAIEEPGGTVRTMKITPGDADIALKLRDHPEWTDAVFYIHGLQWGGGRGGTYAYHALNMHREYLVEGRIRCVFWVNLHESRQIPRHAPDFWAFRHKVVDFPDLPTHAKAANGKETRKILGGLEEAVRKDPGNADGQLELARYLRDLGCLDEARHHYRKAIRLAAQTIIPASELAELYTTIGQEPLAARLLIKTRAKD